MKCRENVENVDEMCRSTFSTFHPHFSTYLHIFPYFLHISKCGYVEVHISPHLNVEVSHHINKHTHRLLLNILVHGFLQLHPTGRFKSNPLSCGTFGPPTPNLYQQGTIGPFIRGSQQRVKILLDTKFHPDNLKSVQIGVIFGEK